MAAVSITAASVQPPANVRSITGIAGETVTAGQVLYYKPSDSRWWKADATNNEKSGTATDAYVRIALTGATAGQPVPLFEPGQDLTVNAVLTQGYFYYVSPTSGGISRESDLGSGNFVTLLGQAISTTVLRCSYDSTGTVV